MSGPRAVQLPFLLLTLLRGIWSGTGGGDGPRNCSTETCVSSPQVGGQEPGLAGIQVLKSASHYWPLNRVEGLNELCDVTGSQTDLVEGVVNKGIYLNGNAGATLLHFGSSKNSCISDLEQCGEAGVSFSFFWKNLDKQSGVSMPSGGKLMSNRFSIYASVNNGFIEFYTHKTSRSWKASISPPGPEWTHILFTWSPVGGLKVYVNGTFSANDTYGKEMAGSGNLVTSTQKVHSYSHYVTGSFDEFVIWERALSPLEIQLYFNATIGLPVCNPGNGPSMSSGDLGASNSTMESWTTSSTNYSGTAQPREDKRFTGGGALSLSFVLPNETLQHQAASNLTQQYLHTVGEFLDMISLIESVEVVAKVSALIEMVDNVLDHVVTSLEGDPNLPVRIKGTSPVADYLLVKLADGSSLSSYRFPSQGLSYIFIPGEAFHSKKQVLMVGMFYHGMHQFYRQINPLKTKISEAAVHKDCPIAVTSHIISLKIDPPPSLSHNLSGSPLTTISLTHILNPAQYSGRQNRSSLTYFWCAFLDFSSGTGVWSNEGCIRIGGNDSHSVCFCNHLTNFAILMQVVPLELERGHQVALSAITYVGCSLSIVCLTVTLVTFAVLSSVSTIRTQRYHIHANLSFAILAAQILLLVSFRFVPGTYPCKILAILLHFFFLSAFSWMLVEGLHLYNMVIKVFGSEESKHFYYYGIGWGSPLVICIVSVTSAFDSYGKVGNCWLSIERGAIWAFVAPALFVVLVNIGILIAVTRIISRISTDNYKIHGDATASKLTMKAVAVLLPILGISWACGVLAINNYAIVFQYIFAFFNSLQGFFIFLFHCVLNSEVRAALKHKTKVWSLNSSSMRNINIKPFHSDIMNGNRAVTSPTKVNTWEKSTEVGHRVELSTV